MSRQYPIWIENSRKSKSFGVKTYAELTVKAGTSSSNSHHFADILISHEERQDGSRVYDIVVDGVSVKRAILANKTFHIVKHVKHGNRLS